jgi:hypothetical protein
MPRKVFTAGEVLAAADVNEFLQDQAIMTFAGTAARGSAIGTATEGMVTYLADSDTFEFWNGTSYEPFGAVEAVAVDFLVIAGGGGGGSSDGGFVGGGGAGAGGYRNSHGTSGANSTAEAAFDIIPEVNYTVTVGAGGAENTNGSDSIFALILSYGGCKGARTTAINSLPGVGGAGGGGQGATYSAIVGFGIPFQGINGSTGWVNTGLNQGAGGGGGGASATGGTAALQIAAPGGAGLASTITGSSVTRGGGGGGGAGNQNTTAASGGAGGGGNGAATTGGVATSGTVNTGGGGGGGGANTGVGGATAGASGGSGLVILRYPDTLTITIGAGLTGTTATDGSDKVTTITAGDGTVSWA